MASGSLFSEEQFLCPICLDVFKRPVTTPCGHNFCLSCITSYWDTVPASKCPICKETFYKRPDLKVNTFISELAAHSASSVTCHLCEDKDAIKSCLECQIDDKAVLCDLCATSLHRKHDLISVDQEYTDKLRELGTAQAKAEKMIQERVHKVQNMKQSMAQSQMESEGLITKSTQDFTELVSEMKRNQMELIRVVEERQNMVEEEAKVFISDLEREISELQEAAIKLRALKSTKDQASFLRNYPSSPALLGKLSGDINKISGGENLSNNAALTYMQQFEVNITLDLSTAHPLLWISPDRKQVRYNIGAAFWGQQIETPGMFTEQLAVLGDRGFASSKFYFEVFVGQKTEWCLGVATASVQRNGAMTRSHHSGLWGIWFLEDKFETFSFPDMAVHLGKVERVGVFVDYDEGEVSFYDVVQATPIYSYTRCFFTEELYPYFNPCDNEYGSNLDPMVIVTASDQ
uniref:Uncharacterized protein n=1 Tax=Oryzias melastigma TaxID=30732 RepID=A0A3B3BNL9_ORYME